MTMVCYGRRCAAQAPSSSVCGASWRREARQRGHSQEGPWRPWAGRSGHRLFGRAREWSSDCRSLHPPAMTVTIRSSRAIVRPGVRLRYTCCLLGDPPRHLRRRLRSTSRTRSCDVAMPWAPSEKCSGSSRASAVDRVARLAEGVGRACHKRHALPLRPVPQRVKACAAAPCAARAPWRATRASAQAGLSPATPLRRPQRSEDAAPGGQQPEGGAPAQGGSPVPVR